MEDREFINEVIDRLIPSSEWWGESNHDSQSLKNIEIQYEALEKILDKLTAYIVIEGWNGNASAEAIKASKREKILWLLQYLDDYGLPELVGYKIVKMEEEEKPIRPEPNASTTSISAAEKE